MSYTQAPFEVAARSLAQPAQVQFVHFFPAIATRHSDTMDCVFRVNGLPVTVSVSCATLAEIREKEHKSFTDQQLINIAGRLLKNTLEAGYDATGAELFLGGDGFRRLARELGYL